MEKMVEGAMQAFAAWTATQPGLLHIHALRDRTTGELVGMSFWRSKEDCDRMSAAGAQAPDAEQKNKALATALQRPLENHDYEVSWERNSQ
jgi:heme-degrading monooxygenase HmoA